MLSRPDILATEFHFGFGAWSWQAAEANYFVFVGGYCKPIFDQELALFLTNVMSIDINAENHATTM